jgi:hypothetical protein
MPVRNLAFFDPKHNEWLFDILMNLSQDQKARLNAAELRKIRNKTAIKQFVALGDFEKKLIMLAKVGVEFNVIFHIPDKFSKDLIKDAYRQYAIKKSVDVIDQMMASKTFVLTSRDVAISLSMMSSACHSDVFIPNVEFMRLRRHTTEAAANISKGMSERNLNREYNEGWQAVLLMARIYNQMLEVDTYLESVLNLQPLDLAILNILIQTPYNYVSLDAIKRQLRNAYKANSVMFRCTYLWKQRLFIDKMPAAQNVPTYRITQEGILAVGEIYNLLLNKAVNS